MKKLIWPTSTKIDKETVPRIKLRLSQLLPGDANPAIQIENIQFTVYILYILYISETVSPYPDWKFN